MALSRNWAQQILHGIGAPVTPQNLRFLAAWQKAEGGGTANNANFNPLNTTQGSSGAGSINSVGVKSYRSGPQGIRATVETLLNGHYGDIVQGLRRNAGANALAHSSSLHTWGTGSGVLRVLGAGGNLSPAMGGGASSPGLNLAGRLGASGSGAGASQGMGMNPMFAALLQSSNELASGHMPDPNNILSALAAARQMASQPSAQSQQLAGQVSGAPAGGGGMAPLGTPHTGRISFEGNTQGLNQSFVNKLSTALGAIGGTRVRITSGYRSPAYNRSIGGASNSNHIYGRAMDGNVFIPGHGWIPLGTALRGVAGRYGLRSGASFTWGGRPDVVHVDDGYNQH